MSGRDGWKRLGSAGPVDVWLTADDRVALKTDDALAELTAPEAQSLAALLNDAAARSALRGIGQTTLADVATALINAYKTKKRASR